jgi:hypothetical protein
VLSLVYGEAAPIPWCLGDPVEAAHGFREGAGVDAPRMLDLFSGCCSAALGRGRVKGRGTGSLYLKSALVNRWTWLLVAPTDARLSCEADRGT